MAADSALAATIGTEYARMLHNILPKVEDALRRGKTSASFQVTAKFRVNGKTGGVDVDLSQSANIPLESANFKLTFNSGQLSLFEASPELSATTAPLTASPRGNTGEDPSTSAT
jgi:hypothetical protein